jgi:hypothetical protein
MSLDVDAIARMLAGEHMQDDAGIREVYLAPAANEVRLIEVTTSVPDNGEVLPFAYAPDPPDVPVRSVVILLGPGDWRRVKAGELSLPETFPLSELRKIA